MKKLLATAAVALALAGGGVVASNHYQTTETKKQEAQKRVEAASIAMEKQRDHEIQTLTVANSKLVSQYNASVKECSKGKAAYDKLSAFAKAQAQAPVCGTALPQ